MLGAFLLFYLLLTFPVAATIAVFRCAYLNMKGEDGRFIMVYPDVLGACIAVGLGVGAVLFTGWVIFNVLYAFWLVG